MGCVWHWRGCPFPLENKNHRTSRKAPEHLAARENALNALHLGRVKHPTSAGKSATVAAKPLRSHNLQDCKECNQLEEPSHQTVRFPWCQEPLWENDGTWIWDPQACPLFYADGGWRSDALIQWTVKDGNRPKKRSKWRGRMLIIIPPLQKDWSSQENLDVSKVDLRKRKRIKMHHSISHFVRLEFPNYSRYFEMEGKWGSDPIHSTIPLNQT